MGLLNWLFGEKKEAPVHTAMVTVGMDSDDWLDWMLDELAVKDAREAEKCRIRGY